MDIILSKFETGKWFNFPDILANFAGEEYDNDTTFTLVFSTESHIVIDTNGKCLFAGIHDFMDHHNIPTNQFTYETGNFKCEEAYRLWRKLHNIADVPFNIKVYPGCKASVNTFNVPIIKSTRRPYKYVNLNNVATLHRVEIINFLYLNNLQHYGMNSFHNHHNELHAEIAKQLPLEVDKLGPNNHHCDHDHLFKDSYFSIIGESVFTESSSIGGPLPIGYEEWWREGALTEKTFRALFHLHPFIIVGAAGSLAVLKSLGFKTFHGVIDESYDDIEDHAKRMAAVQKEILKLCSYDYSSLRGWYMSLTDILLHNQQLYLDIKEKPCHQLQLVEAKTSPPLVGRRLRFIDN